MPTNKFVPSFPEQVDPQIRTHLRQLWDRLNFVLDEVERMKSTTSGSTPALQTQVSNLNVAIQAVRDKLAQQNTYVNFGGTTTVDGIDANGQTGFAWVNNGSWNFLTNPEATAKLSLFSSTAKGLVASPGTATGKFLSDDGTWQVVSASGGNNRPMTWFLC